MNKSCLIGYTGFVGSNLCRQGSFDELVNSKNFREMAGCHYDEVVCAGVSAIKWKANKDPEDDWRRISELMDVLSTVRAENFTLISTVDVYENATGVDESWDCHQTVSQPYGKHRLAFEDFCRDHFKNILVVRLPALFGMGLKKNVIFDLLNDNCLDMINPNSSFQYYSLENLTQDISLAKQAGLELVNLFTEPVSTREIVDTFFAGKRIGGGMRMSAEAHYDFHTRHASLRGLTGPYLYGRDEVLYDLSSFIQRTRA